jgi:hypothetical protein
MLKRGILLTLALILVMVIHSQVSANPGKPNFGPAIYADGTVWGTKGTTDLPTPNDHNPQAFDKLFIIVNSNNPAGQLPVSEAGPGNPNYNGGRWFAHTVEWTDEGFDAHGTVPVLTSYMEIMMHYLLGHLDITPGHPDETASTYFQCPLLPVK